MRKILRVLALAAGFIAVALLLIGLWFVIKPWLQWGLWAIALGFLGVLFVASGILILVARGESNSWNEGQLALQKLFMAKPPKLPRTDSGAVQVATTGPVLDPTPINWAVRKTEGSWEIGYVVLPLLEGQPIWSAALAINGKIMLWPDTYDGQMEAQKVCLDLLSRPALTEDAM